MPAAWASEMMTTVRASRVVNLLLEWLPTEHDPADIVYDGIGHVPMEESPGKSAADTAEFLFSLESRHEAPELPPRTH